MENIEKLLKWSLMLFLKPAVSVGGATMSEIFKLLLHWKEEQSFETFWKPRQYLLKGRKQHVLMKWTQLTMLGETKACSSVVTVPSSLCSMQLCHMNRSQAAREDLGDIYQQCAELPSPFPWCLGHQGEGWVFSDFWREILQLSKEATSSWQS